MFEATQVPSALWMAGAFFLILYMVRQEDRWGVLTLIYWVSAIVLAICFKLNGIY